MGKCTNSSLSLKRFQVKTLSLVLAGILYSGQLYAQEVEFNLPAQSLQQSILQLARQSNVEIIYVGNILKNKSAPQLQGKLSVEQALRQLLQGTNLVVKKQGNVWSIVEVKTNPQRKAAATQLPVITVTADKEKETEKNYTVKSSNSATKLDLSLKDTPQSVSVITQKQMEDQNLTQAVQVLEQAPGVVVASYGAPGAGQAQYYSRGFEITNIQVDGMATTAAGQGLNIMGALDTGIYEQVDVVRGSTGLMAGVGDPSASVNFKRKRPTEEFKGSINLGYGSWNRKRSMFDISGGLNEDNSIRGRMVAIYSGGDSYIDNLDTDNKTLYGILETNLTKKDTLSLGATYSNQHTNGAAPHGPTLATVLDEKLYTQDFGRSYNPATPWTYTDTKIFNGFAEYKHEFNDKWKFNLNYSYSDLDYNRLYGSIGTANASNSGYYDLDNNIATYALGNNEIDGKLHNLDLFVSGKFDALGHTHDVVLGFNGYQGKFYLPQHLDDGGLFGQGSLVPISDWDTLKHIIPDQFPGQTAEMWGISQGAFDFLNNGLFTKMGWINLKEKQYGGYFATRLRPTDRTSVILGTRYAKWTRDTENHAINADAFWEDPTRTEPQYYLSGSANYKADAKFTPYAGILFDITKEITSYLSYTGIYKPQTDANSMYGIDGNVLEPITGNTWEVGVNAGFFDNSLNIHLAAFRMLQNNVGFLTRVC
ncbi:TonB-dependent receptor [Acinetobacter baumannii]|uniref:TonB-dependent siderophore receptor n=1 Tax=Acinetobacter baumannii TaxID=470 RepID=UPI002940AC0A|nr:TonB-dependent receptor [Acinetobacter baumannii]MDV4276676.1 TonB-dependent receptor [Acinetobacter baumannii]